MRVLSLIAAIDEEGGIGKDNQLLCHLPADLKHFKKLTLEKPIIMGSKTFFSIGKPLPQRQNIILTSQSSLQFPEGVFCVKSIEEALALVGEAPEIMIIGGAGVFEQALPRATHLYLTRIHHTFNADVFFPPINLAQWRVLLEETYNQDEKNPYDMTFTHLVRA